MKLSALVVSKNEEDIIKGCFDLLIPYVDEIVVVDMGSTDKTLEIIQGMSDKIKIYHFTHEQEGRIDLARTMSFEKATGDWCLIVDCDEYYPPESMEKIREFIENPGEAISCRVNYKNLSWRG